MTKYKINAHTGELDRTSSGWLTQSDADLRYLKLDQSSGDQTITGGKPNFEEGIFFDSIYYFIPHDDYLSLEGEGEFKIEGFDDVLIDGGIFKINDYSLPEYDGASGQTIETDGSGNLSWCDNSPAIQSIMDGGDSDLNNETGEAELIISGDFSGQSLDAGTL